MDSLLAQPYPQEDHLSSHYDLSPNTGPSYDSFDYHPDPAHFPRTPSYNGSYQNSPYSTASELPPTLDLTDGLGLLDDDNPSGISFTREYDPGDYDLPTSSGTLLTFDDEYIPSLGNNTVSVSVTPPMYDHPSPNAFDHGSPASSAGGDDDHRSRASSTSSYIHPSSPRLDLPGNFERLQFESPHWNAQQLPDRYSPPHKPQSPPQLMIPGSPSNRIESPPIINAPDGDGVMNTGPQLHIVPATPVSGGGETVQNVPFLGAYLFLICSLFSRSIPLTRSSFSLAHLLSCHSCEIRSNSQTRPKHIISVFFFLPPFPFSGGSQPNPSSWDPSQQHLAAQGQNQALPSSSYPDHTSFNAFAGSAHDQSSSGMAYGAESQMSVVDQQQQNQQSSAATVTSHQFLIPQPMGPRSRSLSDTSARPPVWDTLPTGVMPPGSHSHQGSNAGNDGNLGSHSHDAGSLAGGTVNLNDVLPSDGGPNPSNANANILHSPPNPSAMPRLSSSAGPTQTTFGRPAPPPSPFYNPQVSLRSTLSQGPGPTDYLSADHPIGATYIRRSKSENNGNRMFGHRQVRSEDLRSSTLHPLDGPSGPGSFLNTNNPNNLPPPHALFPPPSSASLEFIARQSGDPMSRQYLHPTEALPSISARGAGGGVGHHRRSSSGSRERPSVGGAAGWSSAASSARASPYPSPSASPRPGYNPLPPPSSSVDMGFQMSSMRQGGMFPSHLGGPGMVGLGAMSGMQGIGMGMSGMGGHGGMGGMGGMGGLGGPPPPPPPGMSAPGADGVPMTVSKVNVTTPSTADASQKRRKQPANFACPVPGCGSTFTRHFNLKGEYFVFRFVSFLRAFISRGHCLYLYIYHIPPFLDTPLQIQSPPY